jgi:hypothetical protein
MVTGKVMDSHALRLLKYRDALWIEYKRGESLERLRPIVRRVTILSQVRPLVPHGDWSGTLDGPDDWEGLIHFWYSIRCSLVHGNDESRHVLFPIYTQLAYESLNIFMTEIVTRLQRAAVYKDHVLKDDTILQAMYDHADMFARH